MDKLKLKVVPLPLTELVIDEIIHNCSSDAQKAIFKQFEQQLIDVLRIKGYSFADDEDLKEFARTRCVIFAHSTTPFHRTLHVDGKAICEWSEEWDVKMIENRIHVQRSGIKIL